jgi:hypothetical protein
MDQLSFLNWQPSPEMMVEPEPKQIFSEISEKPPESPKLNLNAIAYWQARFDYYTQLQMRFCNLQLQENKLYRKLEITRIQAFRDECKATLEELSNGCN